MRLFDRSFFERDALDVAPELLNAVITTRINHTPVSIRITEVEAYHGLGTGEVHDEGSHARMGKTARNASMFGPAGHLYIYLIYGLHFNANVVCSPAGTASGVLLRAGEVIAGEEVAFLRRPKARSHRELARGPGRLAHALGLDRSLHDGIDALGELVQITQPEFAPVRIESGPRVGVSGAAGTEEFPWRFWIPGDPTVSPYRPGKR